MGYTQYPNNSSMAQASVPVENGVTEKEVDISRPRLEAVANGEVKKPSFFKRTMDEIFPAPADNKTIVEHVWFDGVVPFIKSAILDTTGRLLFGSNMSNSYTNAFRSSVGNVAYSTISSSMRQNTVPVNQQQSIQQSINNVLTIDQIVFHTDDISLGRTKAEKVLATMIDALDQFGVVTVNDYYDLAGRTAGPFTNANYGWYSLAGADIHENMWNGDCYILLPPAGPIKRG